MVVTTGTKVMADLSRLPAGTQNPLLTVAVSPRALFRDDWDRKGGLEGWRAHHRAQNNAPMQPSQAFPFIRKLLQLNQLIPRDASQPFAPPPVQVHIVTRASPVFASRLLNTLKAHGLGQYFLQGDDGLGLVQFLNGGGPEIIAPILKRLGAQLYLNNDLSLSRTLLKMGIAAAFIDTSKEIDIAGLLAHQQLLLVMDGDGVILSDEAERVFQEGGLGDFNKYEQTHAREPLNPGPLAWPVKDEKGVSVRPSFAQAVVMLRRLFPTDWQESAFNQGRVSPLVLGLMTARGLGTMRRALTSYEALGVPLEAFDGPISFLSGNRKGRDLAILRADLLIDDGKFHVDDAHSFGSPAAHLPWGIKNETEADDTQTPFYKK